METERILRAHMFLAAAFKSLRATEGLLKACYHALELVHV